MADNSLPLDALLVPARDAARMLSISERTLWSITHPRGTLVPVRIGARVLFSPVTLREWVESQTGFADCVILLPRVDGRSCGPMKR